MNQFYSIQRRFYGAPFFLFAILHILNSRPARAGTAEEIVVNGERPTSESERTARTGQSVLIQPRESSRFDTATQLKRESSLSFAETGRISPSGFVIPKIRGQDTKLTDVYLEDTLLQDPYSGLPLIEDLDLRAFGSLELHQGLSPVSVANLNPIGTMRYRFNNVNRSRSSLGISAGSPYGNSLWTLMIHKSENREFRLYARGHQTTGHYRYYSDEGTPYNEKDDERKIRTNNDQRSQQIVPVYREAFGPYALQAMAWFYNADRGLASNSMVLSSAAREHNKGRLGDLSLQRAWNDLPFADSLEVGAHVARTDDKRETDDPQRRVLNSSRQATMKVVSNRQGLHVKSNTDVTQTLASYERSESDIEQGFEGKIGSTLRRRNGIGIFGFAYSPWEKILLEAKTSQQRQEDHTDQLKKIVLKEEANQSGWHKTTKANALSLAFGDFDDGLYLQMARSQRLPSLFEEFGNGSSVRPNSGLKAEKIFHRELGAFTKFLGLEWGAAVYDDKTEDKIVFVPILANASKALNVARTKVRGYDTSLTWKSRVTTLSFKNSKLEAYDLSRPKERFLPWVPNRITVGEWRQQWSQDWSSYLTGRYRSDIYRDLGNSIKLPGSVIYDLNVDYKYRRIDLGLALKNLQNTTDVNISSGSNNKGKTGFSDITGAPLPGRQWVLSFVYTTEDAQ